MSTLSVSGLDEETLARLGVQPARHSVSLEEEAREILRQAVHEPVRVGALARQLFGASHGVDLELPPRTAHDAPDLRE